MFEQIMVPLDGSELAERALPAAQQLARLTGATVHLVRAVELLSPGWAAAGMYLPDTSYNDLLDADTRAATEYLETVRGRLDPVLPVRVAHLSGDVSSVLLDYERDAGIDLVVMCSHGRSGLARFALGSVAERLLHYGSVPVLLVRSFGAPVSLTHTVVPLDGSALAEEALPLIDHVAPGFVQEVTLLRVIAAAEAGPEAECYLHDVAQRLPREHLVIRQQVEQGDPAHAILQVAGAEKLVVMATHGRAGMTRWAVGSVADRVARGGAAGVLLARSGTQMR